MRLKEQSSSSQSLASVSSQSRGPADIALPTLANSNPNKPAGKGSKFSRQYKFKLEQVDDNGSPQLGVNAN